MKISYTLSGKIFIGLLMGAVLGILSRMFFAGAPALYWFVNNIANPVGQVFLRLIFMAVIPLIVAALALGVAEIGDVRRVGRIGVKTLLLTLILSSIAVFVGVSAVNWVQPGVGLPEESRTRLLNMLQSQTAKLSVEEAQQSKPLVQTLLDFIPKNPFVSVVNAFEGGLLPLMVFSLILGLAMSALDTERIGPLKNLLESVFAVMLKIIGFAMKLAPYGVCGLIFSVTATLGYDVLRMLGRYMLLVLIALSVHQIVVYSVAIRWVGRRNPLEFFLDIREVMVTAFSTSSSNATLPIALKVAEQNLKLPREVSNFVLTIGATANQNGTALYEGITVLFLAQFFGVGLTITQQITVVLMSILAGVGTAGVPGGSLPLIVVVLQSIGVPGEGIGIILGVDRILDMSRTVLNVSGDLTIATCIAASETRRTIS